MKEGYTPIIIGELINRELKDRNTSQKDFAKAIGMRPSHLNEVINGKRQIPKNLLPTIASFLGLPIDRLIGSQLDALFRVRKERLMSPEDKAAEDLLSQYDRVVSVKRLLKDAKITTKSPVERVARLQEEYDLKTPTMLSKSVYSLGNRCFRRSGKTGLDERMIATWALRAHRQAREIEFNVSYNPSENDKLAASLAHYFHLNCSTLSLVSAQLYSHGIGLLIVEKEEHASIDGYSFFYNGHPFIAITGRYDRIDNLAFTMMHELGHIVCGHTNESKSMINVESNLMDDVDSDSLYQKEEDADEFAMNWKTQA